MMRTTYTVFQFFSCLCLIGLGVIGFQQEATAQARIQVRVTQVSTLASSYCTTRIFGIPLEGGDSDFVWEYRGTDNTLGKTNNQGQNIPLSSTNYFNRNDDNGPYTSAVNDQFFEHEYPCLSSVPSQINIEWEAYENDDATNWGLLLTEGETGLQTTTLAVPATPGSSSQTFTAVGGNNCDNPQTYSITFEVTHIAINPIIVEDSICNAVQVPVDGTVRDYAWCGNQNFEPLEPQPTSGTFGTFQMTNHGTGWVYFIAPASGNVLISTDYGSTEFGTEMIIYHAADGDDCTAGVRPLTGAQIKSKPEYLSYINYADRGGFAAISSKADINLGDGLLESSHELVPGEAYYLQFSTDDPNQVGYISLSIADDGGNPAANEDIPCLASDVSVDAQSTTVRTEGNGQPESAQLNMSRSYDSETGVTPPNLNAEGYNAYHYNNGQFDIDESVWVQFTPANSGRVRFESDVDAGFLNESENNALYRYDMRFAPGLPSDYSCANIEMLAEAEGGTGILGATKTAIIMERCLEPGYTYYGLTDPVALSAAGDAEVWVYDPSVEDPTQNPPGNDILCLTLTDTLYRVPVQLVSQPALPFASVAGTNELACMEYLAGEPVTNAVDTMRANQTVWHYFIAPPSGVVDIQLRAYIGMDTLNYAVYELLNGTDCYGGLNPATYTDDGTLNSAPITTLAEGRTGFNGDNISLCCLNPGQVYAIQLDGGSPGDEGQYIIEHINEVEVYAGDSQYGTQRGDTIAYNSNDTGYVCYNDSIFPSTMLDILGNSTTRIAGCMDLGYVLHDSMPIPDSIINGNFTYIDSVYLGQTVFVNNGTGAGTFGNPQFNKVYYMSAMADEAATWGQLVCPSASIENGAPVVFLGEIQLVSTAYDPTTCVMQFTVSGGLPAYNGSLFNYVVTNTIGDTTHMGTVANNTNVSLNVPSADTYTITVTDSVNCDFSFTINAAACNNPCIINPVTITPDPIDSTVYTCLPGGDSALVTIFLNGGDPSVTTGQDYTVIVSGSSLFGQNGTFTVPDNNGAAPTAYSFKVADGDTWQVIGQDANICGDTVSALFEYNLTNCPDYCALNPITMTSSYICNANGTALVEIKIGGGAPANDGSNYEVQVTGSSVFGQNFPNVQLPGVIGSNQVFSFVVNDGDAWEVTVMDNRFCMDTLNNTFDFLNDCNVCAFNPLTILPDPVDSTVYNCNPDGSATVTLFIAGGALNTDLDITVAGSSLSSGTYVQQAGIFQFTVADNDVWQVSAIDTSGCTDTVGGLYQYNLTNCANICSQRPVVLGPHTYQCNGDGTATVTMTISGGKASLDGSDYTIDVTGSTDGGNVTGATLAGNAPNGTVQYSFSVSDGDTWKIEVSDIIGCTSTDSALYEFNSTNCPNLCSVANLSIDQTSYICNPDLTATMTLQLSGGEPSFNGANYYVTVIGTENSDTYQFPVAGVVGDTATYTFTVSADDNWKVYVSDDNCEDSTGGTFVWSATACANLCNDPAYQGMNLNNNTYNYLCDGNGNAVLRLNLDGGLPQLSAQGEYIVDVDVNGVMTQQTVAYVPGANFVDINLSNGDAWSVKLYDALGCDTATLVANFNSVAAIATTNATRDMLIGEIATLDGSQSLGDIIRYEWLPTTWIVDPNVASTTTQPLNEITYTLVVEDSLGCVDSADVLVPINTCVPQHTGFTPNGDNTNETWEIPCLTLFENEVEVFNRWGQSVFKAQNYDGTWDGTFNGQPVPDATYYYVIKVKFNTTDPAVEYKGTVTIIR